MENQNKDAAAKVAANIAEERKHPIFEECEVMNAGKPAHEHMLSPERHVYLGHYR